MAFEGSLVVLPAEPVHELPGIAEWNRLSGWRRHYEVDPTVVFFALDAFAGQFGVSPSGIIRFDPESGKVSANSRSLEEWASKILNDYDFETGWSVAKAWQEVNGPLALGYRLLGRRPFVLGGEYEPSNLVAVECSEAMEKLGGLYHQIKGVPDGQPVTIKGWIG